MNYLYSLYDALVSIQVPSDKARAVVDAMERDMTTALATKQDVAELRAHGDAQYALLRQEIETLRVSVTKDIQGLRAEFMAMRDSTAREFEAQRGSSAREFEAQRGSSAREFEALRALTSRDIEALRASMTIRLGSMLVVGLSLLFAALKLT
jgi:hypothetical protein